MAFFSSGKDRKSTRLNSSHVSISYADFCLKKKNDRAQSEQKVQRHGGDRARPRPGQLRAAQHAGRLRNVSANVVSVLFFFNDPATPEIYTLSLHDALPIFDPDPFPQDRQEDPGVWGGITRRGGPDPRSEEHTSELQSRFDLVCRLLLEKKKKKQIAFSNLNKKKKKKKIT